MRNKKRPQTILDVLRNRQIAQTIRDEAWRLWKNGVTPKAYRKPWKDWKDLFLEA